MLAALMIISAFAAVWGFFGIQYTGNYENAYGYACFLGAPLFVVFLILQVML